MLKLWWADPDLAIQYRPDLLQAADRGRAETSRSPRADLDWRVSRALLQQARPPGGDGRDGVFSLSHARGHALVAVAPAGGSVGVDLEALRPRDIDRLAPWCCSADEQAALRRHGDEARRRRAFYLLWTLKEAFIKAANLSFPADMRSVGLAPDAASMPSTGAPADGGMGAGTPWAGWRLRAPCAGWRAYAAVLDDAWMAAVVWRAPASDTPDGGHRPPERDPGGIDAPCWRVAAGARAPRIAPLGYWS